MGAGILIHHKFFPLPFALTTGFNALGYYSIGHLMKVRIKDISAINNIAWYYKVMIAAIWLLLGLYAINGMGTCDYRCMPLDYIAGISGTALFYYVSRILSNNTKKTSKVLAIVGQYTISILIIHTFIANYSWAIFER